MVDVAVHRGTPAAREAAVPVAGLHESTQSRTGSVTGRRDADGAACVGVQQRSPPRGAAAREFTGVAGGDRAVSRQPRWLVVHPGQDGGRDRDQLIGRSRGVGIEAGDTGDNRSARRWLRVRVLASPFPVIPTGSTALGRHRWTTASRRRPPAGAGSSKYPVGSIMAGNSLADLTDGVELLGLGPPDDGFGSLQSLRWIFAAQPGPCRRRRWH